MDIDLTGAFNTAWPITFGWLLGTLSTFLAWVLKSLWNLRRKRHIARLAGMCRRGTSIWLHGQIQLSAADRATWSSEWKQWRDNMVELARQVDIGRAENLDTLRVFPPINYPGLSTAINNELSELHETLKRLSEFLMEVK